jgi:triphosphoribosyl-dephospho-CoA synthase
MRQITKDIVASSHKPNKSSYIAWAAQEALHEEVGLWPKPGLVTPNDTGSHSDMNLTLFLRSAHVLRGYFHAVALAGACKARFEDLRRLGIAAEARMLDATGRVNTHRGAIFSLGLLAAAAGWRVRMGLPLSGSSLGETVAERWGEDIILSGAQYLDSNGSVATRRYAAMGARAEAAAGFPTLFRRALPCLTTTLRVTNSPRLSLVQTLFAIMAELDDTNLLHRGGKEGLDFVQKRARAFLLDGGVLCSDWQDRALELNNDCKVKRLSPGGGADMLAAVWFVHLLQTPT